MAYIIIEPAHDKTKTMACAPSEDWDQPGHPPCLIRVFAVRMKKAWSIATYSAHSEDSDQTVRMPRLIWVFAGRTCHFVGFVMRWLILLLLAVFLGACLTTTLTVRPSQGVPVPLFPCKKSALSLVPKNQNLDFLCSLFPKIAFVPLSLQF